MKTDQQKILEKKYKFQTDYLEDVGKFKVPGLRNVAVTAPYMHNGAFKSLEDVMDFYNKGGGVGLGFPLEYQTLSSDPLELDKEEISDIISFMNSLTSIPQQY